MFPAPRTHEELRETGLLQVVDVDTCIRLIRDYINEMRLTHFYTWTIPPGLPVNWAQAHLELFANKVIQAFR